MKVTPGDLAEIERERFSNQRSRLLTYAARNPGALTAHFLASIREKLRGPSGRVTRSRQLRDVSALNGVQLGHSSLTETRDVREATTLASILDAVNRDDLSSALDILVMRLHALQAAKVKGGTWEKASRLELIGAVGTDILPAGLSGMAS